MKRQKKARKVGRPRMARGEAKARIVPVRFTTDDLKAMTAAARAKKQTVSEWIRSTLNAVICRRENQIRTPPGGAVPPSESNCAGLTVSPCSRVACEFAGPRS